MEDRFKLYDAEYKFMLLVWEHEPVNSTELVKICSEGLGWKKSTTYTVIRKLHNRKILRNNQATVTSLVSHKDIQKYQSEQLLHKSFNSSLPKFLAAFLGNKKITEQEARELKKIIDESRNEVNYGNNY